MEKIKICLASEEKEREIIGDTIRDINEKNRVAKIYCNLVSKQNNKMLEERDIKECKLFISLFNFEINEEIVLETKIALKYKNDIGIFIGINYEGKYKEEIASVEKKLNYKLNLQHFFCTYKTQNELCLFIKKEIYSILYNMGYIIQKIKEEVIEENEIEYIFFDGEKVKKVEENEVLSNNEIRKRLKNDKKKIIEEINQFANIKKNIKDITRQELQEKLNMKNNLIKKVERYIFELEDYYIELYHKGNYSKNLLDIYEKVSNGQIEEASKIISLEEIQQAAEKIMKEDLDVNEKLESLLNELFIKVNLVSQDVYNENRLNETEKTFDIAIKIARNTTNIKIYYEYMEFLMEHNLAEKALQVLQIFMQHVKEKNIEIPMNYNNLFATIYEYNNKINEAKECYLKCLNSFCESDDFKRAIVCCNLAHLFELEYTQKNQKIENKEKMLNYCEECANIIAKVYLLDNEDLKKLLNIYLMLSRMYFIAGKTNKAEKHMSISLNTIEKLENNGNNMDYEKSFVYSQLALIKKDEKKYKEEKDLYSKCIMLKEKLIENDFLKYGRELSDCYIIYGTLLEVEFKELDEAEKCYLTSIEIRKKYLKLTKKSSLENLFYININEGMIMSHLRLGKLYSIKKEFEKAEKQIKQSLEIKKEMLNSKYNNNANYYNSYIDLNLKLLEIYIEAEYFYINYKKDYNLAKSYCNRAIKLLEELFEKYKITNDNLKMELEQAKIRNEKYLKKIKS